MEDIEFRNATVTLAGTLYLPAEFSEDDTYPAIVAVHPGGGVKEQTAGLYAEELAAQGFVTLAFDASHQGESGGLPRHLEDPAARVADIRAAVDYLSTLHYVDADRIGAFGVCAGGGYAINATMTDRRIKAVGAVSPVDIGATFRNGWDGCAPVETQIATLDAVAAQRAAEAAGGKVAEINYVPETVDETTPADLVEAHDYYRTPRCQHPNSDNRMLFTASVPRIFAFDAFDRAEELLDRPVLLVAGTAAGSLWQAENLHKRLPETTALVLVDGAGHVGLYDKREYVDQAVAALTPFFTEKL
ncbi:alpha/beta hydrolase [Nocardia beijingensis]|uniref:alpha/beta hydrolase n=1 Tax=Nocardia beijingensis TaxID=95162 RepID=UPI00082B756A|nr:alpha/beta hydrolase [Nocardia beijingensis]